MRHPGVDATRPDHAVIDPIINNLIARAKSFGHLSDCQLPTPLEFGRWNAIAATDPLDDFHCVRSAFCAGLPFPIEPIGDLTIGPVASQFSNFVHNRGRVAHAVRYVEREL